MRYPKILWYTQAPMKKEKFIVEGLGGRRALTGTLAVNGAKNAALQAFAFSYLFTDALRLENVPDIEDTHHMIELLEHTGVRVDVGEKGVYILTVGELTPELPHELSRRLRASVVLTGPLLARAGRVSFPHPGGCVIGNRPIDIFLHAYHKLGATQDETESTYTITAEKGKLQGAEIFLRVPSVTGTQTLMMAAVLAHGVTVIRNAAMEPETEHLASFLNQCGAKIMGAGTTTITIIGTGPLTAAGRAYRVLPDRIEAGSFLLLAVLAGRGMQVTGCEPLHIEALTQALLYAGAQIEIRGSTLYVPEQTGTFRCVDVKTHEYPGFPTDLQAPMVVFLTQAAGESLVFETIFEGRLNYTESLVRMGAEMKMWDTHRVSVKGPSVLHAKELESPDIRAGLAFLMAAIIAKGTSVIHNAYYIDRGYEDIEGRLRAVGVHIERVAE